MNGSGSLTAVNDFGADGVWARHTLTTNWFYTFDPQGSASQKISRTGSIMCSSVFDAQGRGGTTESRTDPFNGFGGQFGYYADWETSQQGGWYCLCLLGHRFYDPNAGRFINRDPIGYDGSINLYAYTGNDPVNGIDPLGLWAITIGITASGILPILGPVGVGGTVEGGIVIGNGGIGFYGSGFGGVGVGGGTEVGPTFGYSPDSLPPGYHGGPIAGVGGFGGFGGTVSGGYTHPIGEGGAGAIGGKRGEGGVEAGVGGGVFAGPGYGGSYIFPWWPLPPSDNGTGSSCPTNWHEGDGNGGNTSPGQWVP